MFDGFALLLGRLIMILFFIWVVALLVLLIYNAILEKILRWKDTKSRKILFYYIKH